MPISSQALEGLRTLRPGGRIDTDFGAPATSLGPSQLIRGRIAQENRLKDMRRSLELQRELPGIYTSGATPGDVSDLVYDLASDPDFGEEAQARTAARGRAYEDAVGLGFRGTDPVGELATYGRKQAEAKMNLPLEQEKLRAASELARQQEASRGALAVAETQQKGQADFYNRLLGLSGGPEGRDIRSISKSGISFAPDRPVSPALLNPVTAAQRALEVEKQKAESFSPNEAGIATAKSAYYQAVANALSQENVHDDIKDYVMQIISDPRAEGKSLEQILQAQGETGFSPQEIQVMQHLLTTYRGR